MENQTPRTPVNAFFTALAQVVSYVFHPLFLPTYFFLYLVLRYPFEFAGLFGWQLNLRIFGVFWMTAFFPAFAVFLLWRLKFSNGIQLKTQKERIIPYVITMFFYWWMYYLSRNFTDQPAVLKPFYLGIFMASAIGLVLNNFFKVSLHAMGMGGLLTVVFLTAYQYAFADGWVLTLLVFATALVVLARQWISDHTDKDLIVGLLVGSLTQGLAWWVVG
jgi:hypothetical protein